MIVICKPVPKKFSLQKNHPGPAIRRNRDYHHKENYYLRSIIFSVWTNLPATILTK